MEKHSEKQIGIAQFSREETKKKKLNKTATSETSKHQNVIEKNTRNAFFVYGKHRNEVTAVLCEHIYSD